MCIICSRSSYFDKKVIINCQMCSYLVTIPDIVTQYVSKIFDCHCCTNLTNLSNTLSILTELYCEDCPKLITLPNTFVNLTILNCSRTNIIEIPNTFINLIKLYCNSTNITSIPNTFINLELLSCNDCKELIEIPINLIKIKYLYCNYTNITKIPDTFINLIDLDLFFCRNIIRIPKLDYHYLDITKNIWLDSEFYSSYSNNYHTNYYDINLKKLKILQKWFRKNLKFWIFKRWIKSEEGVKWLYNPNNIGGKITKINIMRSINKKQAD